MFLSWYVGERGELEARKGLFNPSWIWYRKNKGGMRDGRGEEASSIEA
jgi:hypothetical protein